MKEGIKKNKSKTDRTWLLFLILSILCVGVVLVGYWFVPQIELVGSSLITINYKEQYREDGFKAYYLDNDLSDMVIVEENVDSNKLGTYKVTYTLGGVLKKSVTRTVVVKDLSKPVLEVSDEVDIYLCPGSAYSGEEVRAYDNYDGDLTSNVVIDINNDKAIYSVKDSSGNKTSITKNLYYEDNSNPEIVLNGSEYVYAFVRGRI